MELGRTVCDSSARPAHTERRDDEGRFTLKRYVYVGCLFLMALSATGCCCPWVVQRTVREISLRPSGRLATQEFNLSGFTRISVSSAFVVNVLQSDRYSVIVTVDDNLVEHLNVYKRADTLYVGLDSFGVLGQATLRATITMPELAGLELSGASRVTAGGFRSRGSLEVEVSGASALEGEMNTGDVRLRISGASSVTLEGTGGNASIEVSGASRARLERFALKDVNIEVSGASSATINLQGRLDAEASGASTILYLGNPQLGRIRESGASSVKPK